MGSDGRSAGTGSRSRHRPPARSQSRGLCGARRGRGGAAGDAESAAAAAELVLPTPSLLSKLFIRFQEIYLC